MSRRALSKGFSAVEAVIIVLVVLALGFGGWYVWQRSRNDDIKKQTNNTSQSGDKKAGNTSQTNQPQQPTYTYPAGEWNEYRSNELGFAFHYPKDWNTINVRSDGSDGFYLADFAPTGEWARNDTYERANIELRGHSASVDPQSTHGDYAKGFYTKDGKYFKIGDDLFGDTELEDSAVLLSFDKGGIPMLLIKRVNYGGYEGLELLANIENHKVIGLNLRLLRPAKADEYGLPAYSQSDIEVMKQVAASFRAL